MGEIRRIGRAATAALLLASAGCAGRPFDVKIVPRVEPDAISAPASSGPLSVRAKPIWDEAWSLENLDANAPLAGVLPVVVELENRGSAPIEAKRLKLRVSDDAGGRLDVLDTTHARWRIEAYYGVGVRSKEADAAYKKDFAANGLDLKTPLAPGEHRQGLVFVRVPREAGHVRVRLEIASKRDNVAVETVLE